MSPIHQSVLFSIMFHIIILIIMLSVKFSTEAMQIPEFIEISVIERIDPNRPIVTAPPATASSNADITSGQFVPPTPATQIDIPEVTFPDHQPVDISSLPERIDRNTPGNTGVSNNLLQPDLNPPNITSPNHGTQTGQNNPGTGINLDGLGNEIRTQTGGMAQYQLQGEVVNRTIVRQVLPEFPEGVQRAGMVTIRFEVRPDGTVQSPEFVRMSEPQFNNVAMAAIRQWVFNRADRTHTGQISFNFILE